VTFAYFARKYNNWKQNTAKIYKEINSVKELKMR